MANIKAQATGLWSAGATWSGGIPPGVGDTGYSNTFTVTIDQDITCTAISNTVNTGISSGGGFVISTNPGTRTLNCDIGVLGAAGPNTNYVDITIAGTVIVNGNLNGGNSGTSALISLSTANVILTVNGTINGTNNGSPTTHYGIRLNANNLTITVNGSLLPTTSPSIFHNAGTGCSITIVGNLTAGIGGSGICISLGSITITMTITGNITGAAGNSISLNTGSHTLNITGNIIAGTASAIVAIGPAVITIIGNITGSSGANAITSSSATAKLIVSGNLIHGANNFAPVFVRQMSVVTGAAIDWTVKDDSALPTGANVHLINYTTNTPVPSDVRSGTAYGPANGLTGTMIIPDSDSVISGVPADATVGSASFIDDKVIEAL